MQRAFLVVAGVVLAWCAASATGEPKSQSRASGIAAAGGGGVYVNAGVEVLSDRTSASGMTAYRIERRPTGGEWKQLTDLQGPSSYEQFLAGFRRGERVVPSPVAIDQLPMKQLWEKIEKYRRVDSLRAYGGVLAFRIALGVTWCDTSVSSGSTYEYRVSTVGQGGAATVVATSGPVTYPTAAAVATVSSAGSDPDLKRVVITWALGSGKRPASLKVYRRDNLQGTYQRINALVIVSAVKGRPLTFKTQDTTVLPYHAYQYVAVPIDFYGNAARASDTVQVATYRFLSIRLPRDIKAASLDSLGGIRLRWRLPDTTNVHGIEIFRSSRWDTAFVKIAEVAARDTAYVDQMVEPMHTYFYRLNLRGLFGERSPATARVSGMYRSTLAPLPPTIVRTQSQANGVKLEMRATGRAVVGFRVFRCAGPGMPIHVISNLVKRTDSVTVFTDTGSALLGSVQYGYVAKAEGASGVLSPCSDTAWVRPAKKTVPPTPSGLSVSMQGTIAVVDWSDVSLSEPTIHGYHVYRRSLRASGKQSEFAEVKTADSLLRRNELVDTGLTPGAVYEYAVRSVDLFGGLSELSIAATATVPAREGLRPPKGIAARPVDGGVVLNWETTIQPGLATLKVYRYERGGKPAAVASLPAETVTYLDKKVTRGKLYFYSLTSAGTQGPESAQSDEVSVRP